MPNESPDTITLFLCGDVMTGRGVDQLLPHPSNPELHEGFVDSAVEYLAMGESAHGEISKPVDFAYIWGDAISQLDQVKPAARIINLETSVTTSEAYEPKGINYRMHPTNTPVLTAAKIDCCVLANNHVIDWGYSGLAETLATLHRAGLKTAGAGQNRAEALQPATVWVGGGTRVLVFAYGLSDSGIPRDWAAEANKPGVALLPDLSERQVEGIAESVGRVKRPGDIAVLSIHWGSNWGYSIPKEHRVFAYRAIDAAGIDVVHGHSSHHPKGIEMHAGKPILYGCGDFFNDYEGISGYEEFRSHLVLMYFLTINRSTGKLSRLQMTPLEIKRFRLNRIGHLDAVWLRDVLSGLGTETVLTSGDDLILQWQRDCA